MAKKKTNMKNANGSIFVEGENNKVNQQINIIFGSAGYFIIIICILIFIVAILVFSQRTNWLYIQTPQIMPQSAITSTPKTRISTNQPGIISNNTVRLLIPGGSFMMGSDTGEADEKPPHIVSLNDFYMDKYEVSNALYKDCVIASKCTAPSNVSSATHPSYYGNDKFYNYPVIYIGWHQAKTYCEWRKGRLPTEAEWEYAARGPEGFIYPWGNDFDSSRANYRNTTGDTSAIDSYETGQSPFGLYNMAGNVKEFVNDWYSNTYYGISISFNPPGPDKGNEHVARGGSWIDGLANVRTAKRYHNGGDGGAENANGFRCAYTP